MTPGSQILLNLWRADESRYSHRAVGSNKRYLPWQAGAGIGADSSKRRNCLAQDGYMSTIGCASEGGGDVC